MQQYRIDNNAQQKRGVVAGLDHAVADLESLSGLVRVLVHRLRAGSGSVGERRRAGLGIGLDILFPDAVAKHQVPTGWAGALSRHIGATFGALHSVMEYTPALSLRQRARPRDRSETTSGLLRLSYYGGGRGLRGQAMGACGSRTLILHWVVGVRHGTVLGSHPSFHRSKQTRHERPGSAPTSHGSLRVPHVYSSHNGDRPEGLSSYGSYVLEVRGQATGACGSRTLILHSVVGKGVGQKADGWGHTPNPEFPMAATGMPSGLQEIHDSRYDPVRKAPPTEARVGG